MSQNSPLHGRRAVVTGGGTGIGLAIARTLAQAGAKTVLMGRNLARLEEAAGAIGATAIRCDVTDAQSVSEAFAQARESGSIDILIANAGNALSAPFGKMTLEQWREMIDLNLTGAYLSAREVAPGLEKADYGRIVFIASTAGQRGYAYVSAYAAAKHGVIGLMRSMAAEYSRTNLTVNAICPGFTKTALVDTALDTIMSATGRDRETALAEIVKNNPQGRLVEPEEVAAAALWLCLEESRPVTGQTVSIAGGEIMT
ncbi:MAG: SDR family oxidoreductase [Parvularculaceae bacterium]